MPVSPAKRIWVAASSAVLAEIWSTTLMLMEPEEIADVIAGNDDVTHVYADHGGRVARIW